MAKREKEEHKGYINFVSPKKTKGSCTHFDVQLQNSPTTPIRVKMFGNDNYKKAEQYCTLKSPVKMKLAWSEKYQNYQLDDRESIQRCNTMEVEFPQNTADIPGSSGVGEAATVTVDQLKEMPRDNVKYYNVVGRLVLGKHKPFKLNNTVVKEDVVVVDTSGFIRVKVWGEEAVAALKNKASYSLSRLKVRRDHENYMTTTPVTEFTEIDPLEITLPSSVVLFPTQIEIVVQKPKRLGGIDRFFSCPNQKCRKKMDQVFASTQGVVHCQNCNDWVMKDELEQTVMVKIIFNVDGADIYLTAEKDVLSLLVTNWSEDVTVATSLLSLRNIRLTYSATSKMILELKLVEEESYDDIFSEEILLDNQVINPPVKPVNQVDTPVKPCNGNNQADIQTGNDQVDIPAEPRSDNQVVGQTITDACVDPSNVDSQVED